jgi:hypothetical protein
MTYDYDQHTADGEQYLATARQLEQSGFTIQDAGSDGDHADTLDGLFDGGPDLETREGCERTLSAVRGEMKAGKV